MNSINIGEEVTLIKHLRVSKAASPGRGNFKTKTFATCVLCAPVSPIKHSDATHSQRTYVFEVIC